MLDDQSPVCGGALGNGDSCQAIEVSQHIKSDCGLPGGNASTFQNIGDVAARVVRDLGRRVGVEYVQ